MSISEIEDAIINFFFKCIIHEIFENWTFYQKPIYDNCFCINRDKETTQAPGYL